jgi:uncharacterized RDD family membrane protein YckC
MTMQALETILSYAALGLIVGFAYYVSMVMNANLAGKGVPRWGLRVIDGTRIGAAIVFFAWLANLGITPVASAFAGFLVGRTVALQLFERGE